MALVIPAGEGQKSLKRANALYDFLIKNRFERTDTIVALGGGVVGDLAGFVAATFLRGVNFIQIPTTLLAMVDSSIGGKVAVNHRFGKNLIGAFYQPKAVLIDPLVLRTLPKREFYNGMAEVIKAAVITPQRRRGHRDLFSFLKNKRNEIISRKMPVLEEIIRRAITIKRDIVQKDEFDRKGIREVLNYGHTIGHAIEATSRYKYRHGEAIALGMVAANNIGLKMGITNKGFAQELAELLKSYHLSNKNQFNQINPLTKLLKRDKKVKSGKVHFVIPQTIGKIRIVSSMY